MAGWVAGVVATGGVGPLPGHHCDHVALLVVEEAAAGRVLHGGVGRLVPAVDPPAGVAVVHCPGPLD